MLYLEGDPQDYGGQSQTSVPLSYKPELGGVAAYVFLVQNSRLPELNAGDLASMAYLYEAAKTAALAGGTLAGLSALDLENLVTSANKLRETGFLLGEDNPFVPGSGRELDALGAASENLPDQDLSNMPQQTGGDFTSGDSKENIGDGTGLPMQPNSEGASDYSQGGLGENGIEAERGEDLGYNFTDNNSTGFAKSLPGRMDQGKDGKNKKEEGGKKEKESGEKTETRGEAGKQEQAIPEQAESGSKTQTDLPNTVHPTGEESTKTKEKKTSADESSKSKDVEGEKNGETPENEKKRYSALRQLASLKKRGVKGMAKEAAKQVAKKGAALAFQGLLDFGLGFAFPTIGLSLVIMVIGWDVLWFLSFTMGFKLSTYEKMWILVGNLALVLLIIFLIGIVLIFMYVLCSMPGNSWLLKAFGNDVCAIFSL